MRTLSLVCLLYPAEGPDSIASFRILRRLVQVSVRSVHASHIPNVVEALGSARISAMKATARTGH
jgi:hypothetical protein